MKIPERKSGQLAVALLIYLAAAAAATNLLVVKGENASEPKTGSNLARLQARISLESKNLDTDNLSEIVKNATTSENKIRRKVKKDRSSRRLSNIWSMFMPGGSASDQDYEEGLESEPEAEVAATSTTTIAPVGDGLNDRMGSSFDLSSSPEKHDEKLVAKYSRPPRQDGSNANPSGELLLVNQAVSQKPNQTVTTLTPGAAASAITTLAPPSLGARTPVELITGSLSNDVLASSMPVSQPNMNDIVSNIMSSMSLPNNTTEPVNVDGVEREEDLSRNRTMSGGGGGGDQFEQWLNRIQFRQTGNSRHQASGSQAPALARPSPEMSTKHQIPSDVIRAMEILAATERARSQHRHLQNNGKIGQRSATKTQHAGLEAPLVRLRSPGKERFRAPVQFVHLRQKSPALHSNKYSAQASTISVNTMDASGSGNISSSSSGSSSGSAATTTTTTSPINQAEQQIVELNSQDEILKQVTSAIDFEQKLNQKKRLEKEVLSSSSSSSPSSPPPPPPALGSGEDLDNNFDAIAEKLRLLAQQQQQGSPNISGESPQQQQQPSWLRPPVSLTSLSSGNLTGLASLISRQSNANQTNPTLERLRELLEKHERTRDELKSSQETMELLMKQLALGDNNNKLSQVPKLNPHQPHLQQQSHPQQQQQMLRHKGHFVKQQQQQPRQQQQQQVFEGWKPVAPMSPGQLLKGQHPRIDKHHPAHHLRISQMRDDVVGPASDYINDAELANNLGLMFASSQGQLKEQLGAGSAEVGGEELQDLVQQHLMGEHLEHQYHQHHHQQHHHQQPHHLHHDLQRAQQQQQQVQVQVQQQQQQQQQQQLQRQAPGAGLRPPVMATALAQQGSGLPVRFREISVYRPFGYESHHAIAYQASPTLAALFPGLTQSPRPSLLRHMTPFRAIQTQRGLLNPMSSVQLAESIRASGSAPQPAYLDAATYHARQALAAAAGAPLPGDDPLGPARSRYLRVSTLNQLQ